MTNKFDYKVYRVGIIDAAEYQRRTLAMAKGEYIPAADEPKLWMTKDSILGVVCNENQESEG